MYELTLFPSGAEQFVMSLKPPSGLATRPMGEILSFEIGKLEKGPNIRPNSTSCCNLSKVSYLCCRADSKFVHSKCTRGPI